MSSASKPRKGRPLDASKRAAVLNAAQHLFLTKGFAGASMDAIAEAAGVSKLTAYKHFGSKQELFAHAVANKCESVLGAPDIAQFGALELRAALIGFGRAFLSLILDPQAMAVHHLVAIERDRTPELGRIFFESAVQPTMEKLAALLARFKNAGHIEAHLDPLTAAQDLLALCRGRPFLFCELGLPPLDGDALSAHVEHAVDLCLRAWTNAPLPLAGEAAGRRL